MSGPCLNGGQCENNGGQNYTCRCQEGWQGDNCEGKDTENDHFDEDEIQHFIQHF